MPDIGKGRKRIRQRIKTLERLHDNASHPSSPAHAMAEGANNEMRKPEIDKASNYDAASNAVPQAGNPVVNAWSRNGSYADDRVSAPVAEGHAAQSPGNRSNFDRPNGTAIAAGHQDLKQGNPSALPWARMQPDQNGGYLGVIAMSHAQRQSAMLATQEPRDVTVAHQDHAGQAGTGNYRADPSGSPVRIPAHTARNSATSPNGTHTAANATCPPRQSMKNSDALAMIKAAMYGGS